MLESNGIGFQFVHTDHKRPSVPHDSLPIDETSLALPLLLSHYHLCLRRAINTAKPLFLSTARYTRPTKLNSDQNNPTSLSCENHTVWHPSKLACGAEMHDSYVAVFSILHFKVIKSYCMPAAVLRLASLCVQDPVLRFFHVSLMFAAVADDSRC